MPIRRCRLRLYGYGGFPFRPTQKDETPFGGGRCLGIGEKCSRETRHTRHEATLELNWVLAAKQIKSNRRVLNDPQRSQLCHDMGMEL
jgi:hypothetical protein